MLIIVIDIILAPVEGIEHYRKDLSELMGSIDGLDLQDYTTYFDTLCFAFSQQVSVRRMSVARPAPCRVCLSPTPTVCRSPNCASG